MKLYLASQSPRRHELLKQINVDFDFIDVDINETWDGKENARDYVERLAMEKAKSGYAQVNDKKNTIVLGADTAVVINDFILGKADNEQGAVKMLNLLSGRMHHVYSGVAVVAANYEKVKTNINRVNFKPLSDAEITQYCKTGEPLGKAGAYAIQGRAAMFIERLEGSYSGVMGMPLYETAELLRQARIL